MSIADLLSWFAGGSNHPYMRLSHCMNWDTLWITITVALDLAVASGYAMIALHWRKNERLLPESPAKRALANMKTIFLFCGICGYMFIPIKMVWPAWRLYDMFLAVLVYYTWRYAWSARELKVVYSELGRTQKLVEDLEATRAEAQRKTLFLNAISHDLRTPLNGLLLQAEVAELDLEAQDLDAIRQALVEIKSCVRTTSDLLNDFLDLSRLDWTHDHQEATIFSAVELFDEVLRRSQIFAQQKGLELHSTLPAGLTLKTDRLKLDRILLNLLNNGLKFTQVGSVRLVGTASGLDLMIDVIDTGEGIAPEHLSQLFDEFYQVHNIERDRRKGFGLGLTIARRLAHLLGGKISVESTPGHGSRFSLFLPKVVVQGLPQPDPSRRSLAV